MSLLVVMSSATAWGSQELILPWSTFRVESRVLPSGVVEISGTQSENGLSKLVIKAFGRRFELGQAQLRELEGMMMNGMHLTYAGGQETGLSEYAFGPTLYILFRRGDVEQRLTVSKQAGLQVGRRSSAAPRNDALP
jgi:hypothetical protein